MFPVQQFPILTPGQMNPFHQALQSGLENFQNNMKTAYLPYQLQADVASKQAYAQNYGKQLLSSVLGNPLVVAQLASTPEGKTQLNSLLSQFAAAPSGQQQMVGLPGQGENQGGGGILGFLRSIGGGQQPTSTNPAASGSSDLSNIPSPNSPAYNAWVAGTPGSGVGTTPSTPTQQPTASEPKSLNEEHNENVQDNYPKPAKGTNALGQEQQGGQSYLDAYLAKNAPTSQQGIQGSTDLKLAEGNAQAQTELYKDEMKRNANQVSATQKTKDTLGLLKYYQSQLRWGEKGPILGKIIPFTSAADSFDKEANNLVANTTRAYQQGHINVADTQVAKAMKPTRDMTDAGFNDLSNFNLQLLNRDQFKTNFDAEAFNKKVPYQTKTEAWNDYVSSHPIFNTKSNSINVYDIRGNKTGEIPLESIGKKEIGALANKKITTELNGKKYENRNGKWYPV